MQVQMFFQSIVQNGAGLRKQLKGRQKLTFNINMRDLNTGKGLLPSQVYLFIDSLNSDTATSQEHKTTVQEFVSKL